MKHELHDDAPEWCLRKSAEKSNNKCIFTTVSQAWRKSCHCVGSLFSCWYSWATSLRKVIYFFGAQEDVACFSQLKSYLKFFFQQDNAPAQIAKKTKKWLENKSIWLIFWPGQSSDLSPIVNIYLMFNHIFQLWTVWSHQCWVEQHQLFFLEKAVCKFTHMA